MTSPLPSPAPARSRLFALDVLRGTAILGILLMNIQSFSMPVSAYTYPWSWGEMSGANGLVYYLCHVVANGKFISIFALLFGAGIILQSEKPDTGTSAALIHFRRMFGLLAIGFVHAYFIWYGDILFSYALLGMVAFAFRRCTAGILATVAVALFASGIVLNLLIGGAAYLFDQDGLIAGQLNPTMSDQQIEVDAYRGTYAQQLAQRMPIAVISQTYVLLTFCAPFVTSLMLAGMALMKSGFFRFSWRRGAYAGIAVAGVAVGWGLSLTGLWADARTGHHPVLSVQVFNSLNLLGTVPAALGYSAAILLLANSKAAPLLAPLAATGRTALSCYLLQSLLCTTIFYGHGLGWFGHVDRVGQLGIVGGVWIVVILFAVAWTRLFRFGPAEWFWRGMTYGFAGLNSKA